MFADQPSPENISRESDIQFGSTTASVSIIWSVRSGADSCTVVVFPSTPSGQSTFSTECTNTASVRFTTVYNLEYRVNITATNCIGSISVLYTFTIGAWIVCVHVFRFQNYILSFLNCVANCSSPSTASGVVIEPYSNTTEGAMIYHNCDFEQCLLPNERLMAVCGSDGRWSPDPTNHICNRSNYGISQ